MGLPTADDMVDCALLVSKLDCQARLLVRIQLSLIAISGSPGRGEKSFLGCQLPGCHEAFWKAGGEGWGQSHWRVSCRADMITFSPYALHVFL